MGRQLYLTSIKLFFGSFCPILISYDLKSAAEGFVELLDINHILAVDKAFFFDFISSVIFVKRWLILSASYDSSITEI